MRIVAVLALFLVGCMTWQPIAPGELVEGHVRVHVAGRAYELEQARADDTRVYGRLHDHEIALARTQIQQIDRLREDVGTLNALGGVLLACVVVVLLILVASPPT